jgi:hypothetical protein
MSFLPPFWQNVDHFQDSVVIFVAEPRLNVDAPTAPVAFMSTRASGAPETRLRPAAPPGGDPRQPPGTHRRGRARGLGGEAEGLKVSLARTNDNLAQADATAARRTEAIHLGIPPPTATSPPPPWHPETPMTSDDLIPPSAPAPTESIHSKQAPNCSPATARSRAATTSPADSSLAPTSSTRYSSISCYSRSPRISLALKVGNRRRPDAAERTRLVRPDLANPAKILSSVTSPAARNWSQVDHESRGSCTLPTSPSESDSRISSSLDRSAAN